MLSEAAGWPRGYDRRVLSTIDSTLDEARRIAPECAAPTWILAHEQTAARGRRGRAWSMPKGNFAATLLIRPEGSPAHAALRSFVAAVAVLDALVTVTGRSEGFALKWPNDVLLNGGKLAGILLESTGRGASLTQLAIGVGVNLVAAPETSEVEASALRPVSLLAETGLNLDPETFLDHLAASFAKREMQFANLGFEPIRTAWLANAARLGETVTARTNTSEAVGRFANVDKDGQLVLETSKGRVCIPAADVYF